MTVALVAYVLKSLFAALVFVAALAYVIVYLTALVRWALKFLEAA